MCRGTGSPVVHLRQTAMGDCVARLVGDRRARLQVLEQRSGAPAPRAARQGNQGGGASHPTSPAAVPSFRPLSQAAAAPPF